MTHDIHALSGAYAVDALDDLERARFEVHLAECADCRAEVDSLREAAAGLAELAPVPPPAGLRDRVLADVARVRPLPPLEAHPSTSSDAGSTGLRRHPRARRALHWPLLAAAAMVLAIVGFGSVVQPWQHDTNQGRISAVDQVLRATDAQRVASTLPDGGRATLVRSVSQRRAVLLTHDLRPAPGGHVYELWLQSPDGRMEPAGLMSSGGDRAVLLHGDAAVAKAAGITIEPAGGSAQPTTQPIALFDLGTAS